MFDDPVVKEVREPRRRIMAECDNDLHVLAERLRKVQDQYEERLVRRSPRRIPLPDKK
ncbi:MAG: hypothetical protein R6V58_03325 [Planctomycetota bacterium]